MSDTPNLTIAQQLCMCANVCTTACHICYSPTWLNSPCIQQLWRERSGDVVTSSTNPIAVQAPEPDSIVCENGCDAWSINSACVQHSIAPKVERFIEAMGDQLLPWQAQVFRAFMGVPTK
jgi:hypothetical protein